MKTTEILNLPFRSNRNSKQPVAFRLTRLCGGGRKTIADGPTTLGEAIGILEAGMHDIDHDRLESVRLARTGVEYDAEQGTIAEEFAETVGDLLEVHNIGDYSASLEELAMPEQILELVKTRRLEPELLVHWGTGSAWEDFRSLDADDPEFTDDDLRAAIQNLLDSGFDCATAQEWIGKIGSL